MATRDGSAEWRGDLKDGSGTVSVASGLFSKGNFSFASRFEEGPGTNPEELIAAAHAGCFAMALSFGLGNAGHPPERLETSARVGFQLPEGITGIQLSVHGKVPGLDEAGFRAAAEEAKANCPVSKALAGVPITLDVTFG
jgi:osmotically inducible protein OsmC